MVQYNEKAGYGLIIAESQCSRNYRPMVVTALHTLSGRFKMGLFCSLFLFYTTAMYLPFTTKSVAHATSPTQKILILGGNGFLGSSLVAKLLSLGSYKVTTLNRGRNYFDSKTRIDPHVEQIACDRGNIYDCTRLVNSTQYYDAIADYSSYYMEDLQVCIMYSISCLLE